jgi:hypothetical protein
MTVAPHTTGLLRLKPRNDRILNNFFNISTLLFSWLSSKRTATWLSTPELQVSLKVEQWLPIAYLKKNENLFL